MRHLQRLSTQHGCDSQHKRDDSRAENASTKSHRSRYLDGKPKSVFLQHHFGGLDDYFDGIALLEAHGFGATPRDHAFDKVVAHFYDYVGHHSAELKLLDDAGKLIAS